MIRYVAGGDGAAARSEPGAWGEPRRHRSLAKITQRYRRYLDATAFLLLLLRPISNRPMMPANTYVLTFGLAMF